MARVVFVTTRLCYPPKEGHQLRTYNLLRVVAQEHDVTLLSFVRGDDDLSGLEHLQSICSSVETFTIPAEQSTLTNLMQAGLGVMTRTPYVVRKYFSPNIAKRIEQLVNQSQVDLIHYDMLPLAKYQSINSTVPAILNNHNVESLLVKRRAELEDNFFVRLFFKNQYHKLHDFEAWACESVKQAVVCSQVDAVEIAKMAPNAICRVIPNGVNTKSIQPVNPVANTTKLIFVGSLLWLPNKDAIDYFIEDILDLIIPEIPGIHLTVVGNNNGYEIPERYRPYVSMPGFVDDLDAEMDVAAVYVVPIRFGSGTRLKILEAMAYGIPLVSTSVGCEGIELAHEKNVLVADDPQQFAAAVIRLLNDAKLAKTLSQSAVSLAREKYDWDSIGQQLLGHYAECLNA